MLMFESLGNVNQASCPKTRSSVAQLETSTYDIEQNPISIQYAILISKLQHMQTEPNTNNIGCELRRIHN